MSHFYVKLNNLMDSTLGIQRSININKLMKQMKATYNEWMKYINKTQDSNK